MNTIQRSPALTQKDVWDAADTLEAEGESVSQQTVHHYLGRGSMSTISRHLATWRRNRVAVKELADVHLPIKPPDYVAAGFMDMWSKVVEEARALAGKEVAAERRAAAEIRESARKEVDLVMVENRTLAQRAETAEGRLEEVETRTGGQIRELTEQVVSFKEEVASLSASLKAERERSRALADQLEEAKATLEQARQDHREQLNTAQVRSDAVERRLVEQIEEHRKATAHAKAETVERTRELQRAQERADHAQIRADQADTRADQANALVATLRGEVKELETARRAADRAIADGKVKIAGLEKDLATRTTELEGMAEIRRSLEQDLKTRKQSIARMIDPGALLDWFEAGMQPPAGKAFEDLRLRDIGRVVEKLVAKA